MKLFYDPDAHAFKRIWKLLSFFDDKRNYQRYGEKKKGKLNNNELSYKRYIKLYYNVIQIW